MADLILTDAGRPFLYLGNQSSSVNKSFLAGKNIKYIVNCTKDLRVIDGMKYLRIPVDDYETENISAFFGDAVRFIEEARKKGDGAILVHCVAGMSRSPTVTLAYLLSRGMKFPEALSYLVKKRHQVRPNRGFFNQLRNLSGSNMSYTDFTVMRSNIVLG